MPTPWIWIFWACWTPKLTWTPSIFPSETQAAPRGLHSLTHSTNRHQVCAMSEALSWSRQVRRIIGVAAHMTWAPLTAKAVQGVGLLYLTLSGTLRVGILLKLLYRWRNSKREFTYPGSFGEEVAELGTSTVPLLQIILLQFCSEGSADAVVVQTRGGVGSEDLWV